eukprot:TRINITY_DN1831_c0_g1_i4.p1 TRINITY_DN1831_c0_g1~~TRINITY_DN1831_c0_g1_i4.p1  ORF type:complete len:672 (+),score=250.42 TRINITY_DN1831_c0_g1_i4:71-2086(+)
MSTMIEKPVLRESELRRLGECLQEPEFRGLLLEYVREVSGNEAQVESQLLQAAVLAQEDEVEVLKPSGGFVLQESEGRAYVNLCIESKVGRPSPGETKGLWSIPYAMPSSSRPHANADGSIAALYDVLFHPSALKKASRNRRFKVALRETALSAVLKADPTLSKESFRLLPHVSYLGKPRPLLLRPQKPEFTLKYREASPKVSRPLTTLLDVHLPEFSGAANIDLDVSRRSVSLKTSEPVPYFLHLPLSYPVDEEKGSAKFDKNTRILHVSIPIIPIKKKKMERLLSVDSGIDSDDVTEALANSPEGTETEDEVDQEESDIRRAMFPSHRLDLEEDSLSFTLDVRNIDPDSLVTTPFSSERLRGYRIAFSTLGSGLVRYDYSFAFAISFGDSGILEELPQPKPELWDNSLTFLLPLRPSHLDCLVGKGPGELRPIANPSLKELRANIGEVKPLKKEEEKPVDKIVQKDLPKAEPKKESSGRFSVTPLDSSEAGKEILPPLPPLIPSQPPPPTSSSSIRGILKRRVRSYSESQADQIRRWEEAAASLTHHGLQGLQEEETTEEDEEEEEGGISNLERKKSVRFNDIVQRQTFRANASILGQRMKNMKKNEQKKRKNALRERRASEGDAEKESPPSLRDSGVFSEEDIAPKSRDDALSVFRQSETLMFELDEE